MKFPALREEYVINELVKLGAKIDVVSNLGNTPLHFAATESRSLFDILVKVPGININVQDGNGDTVLHKLTERDGRFRETINMVDKVLKIGADCNIANNLGW